MTIDNDWQFKAEHWEREAKRLIAENCSLKNELLLSSSAALSVEAGVVKPLAFDRTSPDGSMIVADSVFGEYWAWEIDGTGLWSRGSLPGVLCQGGISKAIAAAQADYSARILSALTPAPAASEPAAFISREFLTRLESSEHGAISCALHARPIAGHWDVPLYTHPATAPAGEWRTVPAKWTGDSTILPSGADVTVVAVDNDDPSVPARRAAWVRYWPGNRDYPMYRSCDLSDLDLPTAPTPQTEGGANG